MSQLGQPLERSTNSQLATLAIVCRIVFPVVFLGAVVSCVHPVKTEQRAQRRWQATTQLLLTVQSAENHLAQYSLTGDRSKLDLFSTEEGNIPNEIAQLLSLHPRPESQEALKSLQAAYLDWSKEIAHPMIEQRKKMDAGPTICAELLIFYLTQEGPARAQKLDTAIQQVFMTGSSQHDQ